MMSGTGFKVTLENQGEGLGDTGWGVVSGLTVFLLTFMHTLNSPE